MDKREAHKGSEVMGGGGALNLVLRGLQGRGKGGEKERFLRGPGNKASFQQCLMAISRCISQNPISSSVSHDRLYIHNGEAVSSNMSFTEN